MKVRKYLYLVANLLFLLCTIALGQNPTGNLHGQVSDPSGAAISGASVVLTPAAGPPVVVQSNAQGLYEFKNVAPGHYTLTVAATGFTLYENANVTIADRALRLDVSMTIDVETQKVLVSDTAPTVDVNPNNNAGAITISGKELEALPDDPDELQSDLEALAGPSAGPNGGQMYIDGFTAGQLPPKSSIREIRINQNPFSSEYDKLGYGRIEIFTKPGTDKWHGQVFASGNDSSFNAPNPFIGVEPPYYSTQFNGNIGGPLSKKASVFFNVDRRDINDLSAINATDPSTGGTFVSSVANPRQRTNLGPRFDWAITKNNTLTARYQYYRDTESGNLTNQFSLPTQSYYTLSSENTLQLSDTQVFGANMVNETRFQYNRDNNVQNPQNTTPAVSVLGNFLGGGNSEGSLNDLQNAYELQNYTSLIHGNHTMKFGARFRATRDGDYSTSAFNGTFIFPSLAAYQQAESEAEQGLPATGATQLSIVTGSPNAAVNYYDFEPYFQDDWRVRPNITLSYGLRFETQNAIHDHGDWAPRFGFAWGVGGRSAVPKVVIRGGSGIFYDRFQVANLLQAERLNGAIQTQYVVLSPNCFPGLDKPLTTTVFNCGTPPTTQSSVYQISPTLHAPYTVQSAISVERQVTKSATLTVNYLNSRGFDQFITTNANAPYPGTPCSQVTLPFPGLPPCAPVTGGNLYRYVSEANFKQNQLMVISNVRVGSKLQLFGYYSLNYAKSDTGGVTTFPTNSYDISQDYGRGSFDIRNRLFMGGSIGLPYLFRLSPFMVISSGSPFNLMSPYDLNGDSQYNDRPGLVSNTACSTVQNVGYVYCTPLGTFDATGASGQRLPVNYGTGPGHFVMNLRLSKTIGLGAKTKATDSSVGGPGGPGGGGHRGGPLFGGHGPMAMSSNSDRRYNLILSLNARNVFNNVNAANPSAVIGSRFFDVSNSLQGGPFSPGSAANRRLDLQATFSF